MAGAIAGQLLTRLVCWKSLLTQAHLNGCHGNSGAWLGNIYLENCLYGASVYRTGNLHHKGISIYPDRRMGIYFHDRYWFMLWSSGVSFKQTQFHFRYPFLFHLKMFLLTLAGTIKPVVYICFLPDTQKRSGYDDVIKWKHFPRYWPFVWGIHRSLVNSPHKGQWCGALMFFFYLRLNRRLSKQSWGWWFEMPSRSLWRHCNDP